MLPYTAKHFARRLSAILLPLPRVLPSHTPQSPLERGVIHAINRLLLMRKQYFESPLFERGRGCVMLERSFFKSKIFTNT